jgi:hypothetical protein
MYFTKAELRERARSTGRVDFANVLKEDVVLAKAKHGFDIFLCHAKADADIVLGAKKLLEDSGKTVYVDWLEDKVDHGKITRESAEQLRKRMRECNALIFLATQNAPASVWMPWELGYFDGMGRNIAIFPVLDNAGEAFADHQFLQLYPKVNASNIRNAMGRKVAIVETGSLQKSIREFATR